MPPSEPAGALAGIRILDLSRILAGPVCTQLLADYGAEVIKLERPGEGDDTRKWGPPFVKDAAGADTDESTFYLSANRNKRSVAIDFAKPEGQRLVHALVARADVMIENLKVGTLARYGLDWASLRVDFPRLVYCSITGFGQTGPYAERAGYDFLAQGMGGIMSVTGEPAGEPVKVGIGIADIMTGMHAAVAILAALRHRDATGAGQHIDLALLDTQVSWTAYHAVEYLNTGNNPARLGNAHASVVPYQVFPTADGHVILAAGNDSQFRNWCRAAGVADIADDARYRTNPARIANRDTLIPLMQAIFRTRTIDDWVETLRAAGVPCGPINTMDRVFADPQVEARAMAIEMAHPASGTGTVHLVANPAKLSATPLSYRRPPPMLGEHTEAVLSEALGLDRATLAALRDAGVIAG
ncbi:MAG: CoA transferase [Alphaproteobacteria bacterium]|nr:CoA transferase [Alphaproteobacteria bacterium]